MNILKRHCKAVAALLLLALTGARAHAGTVVWGRLIDLGDTAFETKLSWSPTNLVMISAGGLQVGATKTITATNGYFTNTWDCGDYWVKPALVPQRAAFLVAVPCSGGPYNISNLIVYATSYIYTNSWGGGGVSDTSDKVGTNEARAVVVTNSANTLGGNGALLTAIPLSGLAQSAATSGQVPKWNGSVWLPAADDTSAGGSGIGTLSGTGTNTTFKTTDNTSDASGAAIVARPMVISSGSSSAASLLEMWPAITNGAYFPRNRFVTYSAPQAYGSDQPDIIFAEMLNYGGNNAGSSTYGPTTTNYPGWIHQREGKWQNNATYTQLEDWYGWTTPFTQWGTNWSGRFMGFDLVWKTSDSTYYSTDGNITVDSFSLFSPGSSVASINFLPAQTDYGPAYMYIYGTVTARTNTSGGSGFVTEGGNFQAKVPTGVTASTTQIGMDWNNNIGVRPHFYIYHFGGPAAFIVNGFTNLDISNGLVKLTNNVSLQVGGQQTNLSTVVWSNAAAANGIYMVWNGSSLRVTNPASASTYADIAPGGITGVGTALTALNADNLGSGTVPNARLDAELAAIAGLTSAANKGIYFTGSGTASTFDLSATALTLLDDTSTSTMRSTLGLAIGSDVQAYDSDLVSLSSGITGLVKGAGNGGGYSAAAFSDVQSLAPGTLLTNGQTTATTISNSLIGMQTFVKTEVLAFSGAAGTNLVINPTNYGSGFILLTTNAYVTISPGTITSNNLDFTYHIKFKQDATGGRTVTWNTNDINFPNGTNSLGVSTNAGYVTHWWLQPGSQQTNADAFDAPQFIR